MSIIAVKGIPAKFSLLDVVKSVAKLVAGPFEPLNFTSAKYGMKTCYLRLSERLDPVRVVERINGTKLGRKKFKFVAYVPEHVPDLPLASKKLKIPMKLRDTLKIPELELPHEVITNTHNEVFSELQYRYPGLFNLSRKTGHKLLDELARIIGDRLKHIMDTNHDTRESCFRLSKCYRKTHPHFGDFQLILSTLHRLQDASGAPRAQIQEADLAAMNPQPYMINKVPLDMVKYACHKYSQRVSDAVSSHVASLDSFLHPYDSEEIIARKKVREELKKMATYLGPALKQVIASHFIAEEQPYRRVRMPGESSSSQSLSVTTERDGGAKSRALAAAGDKGPGQMAAGPENTRPENFGPEGSGPVQQARHRLRYDPNLKAKQTMLPAAERESPNAVLERDKTPNALLVDRDETPNALLVDRDETPNALLVDRDEIPNALLVDRDETPTAVLVDKDDIPNALLIEKDETPTPAKRFKKNRRVQQKARRMREAAMAKQLQQQQGIINVTLSDSATHNATVGITTEKSDAIHERPGTEIRTESADATISRTRHAGDNQSQPGPSSERYKAQKRCAAAVDAIAGTADTVDGDEGMTRGAKRRRITGSGNTDCTGDEIAAVSKEVQIATPQPSVNVQSAGPPPAKKGTCVVVLDRNRIHMNRTYANQIRKTIDEAILNIFLDNEARSDTRMPQFMRLPKLFCGGVRYTPRDDYALAWLTKTVEDMPALWEGSGGYIVVPEKKIPKYKKGVILIPDFGRNRKNLAMRSDLLISYLAALNPGVGVDKWQLFKHKWRPTRDSYDHLLIMGIPLKGLERLRRQNFRLHYTLSTVFVKVHGMKMPVASKDQLAQRKKLMKGEVTLLKDSEDSDDQLNKGIRQLGREEDSKEQFTVVMEQTRAEDLQDIDVSKNVEKQQPAKGMEEMTEEVDFVNVYDSNDIEHHHHTEGMDVVRNDTEGSKVTEGDLSEDDPNLWYDW